MNLDSFSNLATPIVMGILLGGLYSLIALGLSLVFGVMKLINVAHGDLVLLSSYLAFALFTGLGIDPILSLVIGIPVLFGLGFLIQTYLMNRSFKTSMEAPLIIAFGLSIIFQNVYQIIWSPMSRGLNASYALKSFTLGNLHIPLVYIMDFGVAIIVMLFLREFLRRTYLGKAINAASQDRVAAHLMGINTNRVYAFAFAIAMAFAAIAGVFLGLTFPFTASSGPSYLIVAFGVVVLGGMGNMLGTFLGGAILGLAQTLGGYYLGATAQMLVAYIVVLVVLTVRPQGIFGR
jgi:branched-chain amino acid transport system permease protein